MLLNIEPGLIIWTIVTFVVLLVVLRAVAWKPLLTMLDEREGRIQEALSQADKARQDAEAAAAENREAISKAQAEAQAVVAQSREAAEQVAQNLQRRSQAEAAQMLEQARRTIGQEKERAILELRNQVGELAILAAGKILEENLDDARSRKIVDQFIDDIPDSRQN
jgi:F-type H+-transporting ATPase subunit b